MWELSNRHLAQSELAFKAKQEEITRLALHDTLTGLPNRRYLYMQLPSMIAHARRLDANFALLLLDLDDFKPINDNLGHDAGDAVLKEVGRRLEAYVRKDEFAARLGGDEFIVVLSHGNAKDGALHAAERLISVVAEPIILPQHSISVSLSIGASVFPVDATEPDDLIQKADAALYHAKSNTDKNIIHFYQSKQ
jgi:diguanylate cyclase (GGDEF)-like protein